MASYVEINELLEVAEPTGLRRRVAVGTLVAADAIRQETDDGTAPVRQRKRFAQQVLKVVFSVSSTIERHTPDVQNEMYAAAFASSSIFEAVYRSVLIANIGANKSAITSATDTQIQGAVDAAVDLLAASFPDPVVVP